ncbi:hypothetical protein F5146DRAFT_1142954 [Armillaria mellea]|nr:hypothetical protein F5146DRAFT_1142954 [Armillaria mellea]
MGKQKSAQTAWLNKVRVLDDDIRKEASQEKRLFKLLIEENRPNNHLTSEKKQQLPHVETSTAVNVDQFVGYEGHRCSTCHQFYTNHIAPDCKAGLLEHVTYYTLTESDALTAKTAYKTKRANTIASIQLCNSSILDNNEEIIRNSSDSGNEPEYVSSAFKTSLMTPHLWMEGFMNSSVISSPLPICVLIDHGSPTVLIKPNLVAHLGLHI